MKTRIVLSVILSILFTGLNFAMAATTYTWKGASGGSWTDPNNWNGGPSGTFPGGTANITDNVALNGSTVNYSGGIIGAIGTITSSNTNTINLTAALTTTGLVTVNQDLTLTGGALFTANGLTIGEHNLTINTPFAVTNIFTVNGSTITGNSVGAISVATMAISSSSNVNITLKAIANITNMSVAGGNGIVFSNTGYTGAATNITGTLSLNMGSNATGNTLAFATPLTVGTIASATSGKYTIMTNTGSTLASNLAVTDGTAQIGSSGIAASITVSGATTSLTAGTLTLYNGAVATGTMALAGPLIIYGTNTFTSNGTSNTISGGIAFQNVGYALTFLGTGTNTITGTVAMAKGNDLITVGSASSTSTTVTFGAGTSLTSANSTGGGITNYGNLNFNGTATSPVTLSYATPSTTINNVKSSSVINAAYTNIIFNNNGSSITNAGDFNSNNSSVSFFDATSNFTNSGNFTATAFTLTAGTKSTSFSLVNSGNFQADGGSSITFQGAPTSITNSGNFTAGTSNSPCVISVQGNNSSIISNGTFILGSTSAFSLTSPSASVLNTGFFTLMSDAFGSATISQVSPGSTFRGTYNVQRYIKGKNSLSYRGYRLLSSPVNVTNYTSSTTGSNYINLQNLSTSYTVNGIKYYGAATGGPGGGPTSTTGFTINNGNPTIFFYNEPTPISGNGSFLAGKNVGVSAIGNPALTLTSTQYLTHSVNMPVGNGYIMFYIGTTLNHPTGAMIAPDDATITYPGFINQQDVPVFLWYTPGATGTLTPATAGTPGAVGTPGKLSITANVANIGLNMLGNPYPSIIDLNQVYKDNSNATGFTTFWELTDIGQQYVSYNANSGAKSSTTYSSQYVASGQGFVVQATAPNQSLTFKEDQKVPYNAIPVLSGTTTPPILLSLRNAVSGPAAGGSSRSAALIEPANTLDGLHLKMAIDTVTYTECGIYFSNKWADAYDPNDAIDIGGVSPKMYLSSLTTDGYKVGINSLADYTRGKRVKIYVAAAADGNYNLGLADIQNIDTALFHVYLVDNLKKDSVDLISSKGYPFTVTNADTTTYGSNRFVLAVERKALPPYQLLSFTAQKASDGVLLTWKTSNESTYTGFSIEKQDGSQYTAMYSVQSNGDGVYTYTDHKPASGTNTYRLGQNDIDSLETYSNPVSVIYSTTTASSSLVSVYPNPAKEQITVSFSGATNANTTYTASIFNSTGLLVGQKSVSGDNWSQDVSTLRPGGYILEIRSGNGSIIGNTKFTKYQ